MTEPTIDDGSAEAGSALVHGLGIAGIATVRALRARGWRVLVSDDRDDERVRTLAEGLDVEVIPADRSVELLDRVDLLVPAPGVPETHPLVVEAQARRLPVQSEIELAYRFEQERADGPRPMLAVTGTDGKTTTTLLAAAMLEAAGVTTVASGNTDVPLLDAIAQPVDAFVVECTSFRLAWTERFRAEAAVWLNLAPDHLNWHRSMATYEAAKGRIFQFQRPDDAAIGFADDPVVLRHLDAAPGRRLTFGLRDADYRVDDGVLVGPMGAIVPVAEMRRSLPHDITNALAAAALVLESGLADTAAVAQAVGGFVGPPHRIEALGTRDGVSWYNDSKATTPHAASVAIRAFDRVVLIAGGRNKGLDLDAMAAERDRVRTLVAIGEAGPEIAAAFGAGVPSVVADSMEAAVEAAASAARPGDVVLLSPGCASFDWYPDGGYPARGDHFRELVDRLVLDVHGGTPR